MDRQREAISILKSLICKPGEQLFVGVRVSAPSVGRVVIRAVVRIRVTNVTEVLLLLDLRSNTSGLKD
jgi:hypothetical protein